MYGLKLRPFLLAVCLGVILTACQTTAYKPGDLQNTRDIAGSKVVLMPLDVELSELTAGGAKEPKAQWTAQAHKHLKKLIEARLAEGNIRLLPSDQDGKPEAFALEEKRLTALHGVVGSSIVWHKALRMSPALLPTKEKVFDWELGQKVRLLKEQYNADYGLFVFVRDSYASAGRAAVMLIGAVLGAHMQGGHQVGYASLVDLNTGRIEWFNFLNSGYGDLRTEQAATGVVDELLTDFPSQ